MGNLFICVCGKHCAPILSDGSLGDHFPSKDMGHLVLERLFSNGTYTAGKVQEVGREIRESGLPQHRLCARHADINACLDLNILPRDARPSCIKEISK